MCHKIGQFINTVYVIANFERTRYKKAGNRDFTNVPVTKLYLFALFLV
jgi:hypothetical protein